MLTDDMFDSVFMSEYMKTPTSIQDKGYAAIFMDLKKILEQYGYKVNLLKPKDDYVMTGRLSVWCRDYMPLQIERGQFLRFAYTPDYLKCKKYSGHEPDNNDICNLLGISAKRAEINAIPIVLDGGNVVRCGNKVLMVDKVLAENSEINRHSLIEYLENSFQAELVFLEWDHREALGHSDGIARYVGNNKVVMITYGFPCTNKKDRYFNDSYHKTLEQHGLSVLPIDFSDICCDKENKYNWAYTNWLQLNNLIIIPRFKDSPEASEKALRLIRQYTQDLSVSVESIEATALVKDGGAFNCSSWTIWNEGML